MADKWFRKRPVAVRAFQLDSDHYHKPETWPEWLRLRFAQGEMNIEGEGGDVTIETLEGEFYADVDDWIIEGVHGEIYPCKPDIFAATYDEVEEEGC